MPCGGISPTPPAPALYSRRCWFDDGNDAELFVEEWDTFLHVKCLIRFLQTEEGRCVMAHGHEIYVPLALWGAPK